MSGDEPPEGEEPNVLVKALQTATPDLIRRSFAIKFGLVLLIMGVSIGGVGLAATTTITEETRQNVQSEYRGVSISESDIINQWLERNRLSARLVSSSTGLTAGDASDIEAALRTQRASLSADVQHMHIVGEFGRDVVASTDLDPGTDLTQTQRANLASFRVSGILSDLQVDDVYVSNTYAVDQQRVVAFASPVAGGDSYLVVEVSVFPLAGSLQGADRAKGGFTQVVETTNNTIMIAENSSEELEEYAPAGSEALEPVTEATALRNETGPGSRAVVFSDMPASDAVIDQTYTVGASPVEDKNWVVLVHAPKGQVFGFVQTISNFGLGATIFMVLLIGTFGTVLGYSTSTAIDRLTNKTQDMREGDLDVTFYTARIDNIGRLYEGFAEMRDALKQQIEEAERARKEAEVSRAEAMEMSNYLQEKAEEYSDIMQQCAAGDLTQRMDKDGENESMDQIADEFNEMIGELEKTTGQLKSYVDEVEAAGSEVEQSANTVREASESVADSIQTISDDAYDQKERLQEISETMDGIASNLEDFADDHPDIDFQDSLDRIKSVAENIEQTAELSESTMAESENVAGAAEEQAAELNEVGERAHDLQRYAQPLRDILNRFETEAEHEFVFSVGPTGGGATGGGDDAGEDEGEDDEQ